MAKFTREDLNATMRGFEDVTYDHFKNHSFAAGAYSSIILGMFEDMPKHKQAEILKNLHSLTLNYAPELTV